MTKEEAQEAIKKKVDAMPLHKKLNGMAAGAIRIAIAQTGDDEISLQEDITKEAIKLLKVGSTVFMIDNIGAALNQSTEAGLNTQDKLELIGEMMMSMVDECEKASKKSAAILGNLMELYRAKYPETAKKISDEAEAGLRKSQPEAYQ